jgi:signal transduction histidine kinase
MVQKELLRRFGNRYTILICNNNNKDLSPILKEYNFKEILKDTYEATEKTLEEEYVDIVILNIAIDQKLEEGIALISKIREKYPIKPIIAIIQDLEVKRCIFGDILDLGINAFVKMSDMNGPSIINPIYYHLVNQIESEERISAMKDAFEIVSHQWKQPLATMSMLINNVSIKHEFGTLNNDEIQLCIEEMSNKIMYLSSIINRTKSLYSRSDEIKEYKMITLVEEISKGLKVRLQHNINSELIVSWNYADLIMVFESIIINSIDVVGEDASVSLLLRKKSNHIEFTIEDNGPGFTEENLSHLFEPYYSTKSKNERGMDLFINKLVVERNLKGHIYAYNGKSGGACFKIKLPL